MATLIPFTPNTISIVTTPAWSGTQPSVGYPNQGASTLVENSAALGSAVNSFNSQTATVPFQTPVTMDGNNYTLSVVWNLAGQRYYFSIVDQNGNLIVYGPLVGSPLTYDINLVYGYFTTSTLVFQEDVPQFVVGP